MMGKSHHAAVIVGSYIIYVCTAIQKFGISKILNVFKEVSYAHQGWIYLINYTEEKKYF